MPLYPLGITRSRDAPHVAEEGLAGSPGVRWSRAGELACAFVDAPHDVFKPLQHAVALGAIHRRMCVLPMRFGVAVGDEAEIHALLQTRRGELLDHLDRLDGACEMALRITLRNPPATFERSSTPCVAENTAGKPARYTTMQNTLADSAAEEPPLAYLARRRSHYQQVDATSELDRRIVRQLLERFEGAYRDWRRLPAPLSHLIRLAFLVERDRVEVFRSRAADALTECRDSDVGRLAAAGTAACGGAGADVPSAAKHCDTAFRGSNRACREGRCVVLGPWPPYSFV